MSVSLQILSLGGELCTVNAELRATALELKTLIQAATGIPQRAQRLLLNGVQLTDTVSLEEAGIDGTAAPTLIQRTPHALEWLDSVQRKPAGIISAPEWVKVDQEIVLAAAQQKSELLEYADPILWSSRLFVLSAVRLRWSVFKIADDELKADREFVLAAARLNWRILDAASEDIRADNEFILKVLEQDARRVNYIVGRLRGNARVLEAAPLAVRNNRELILSAVRANPQALAFSAQSLREDRDFVMAAFQVDATGRALNYVPEDLRDDHEVVLAAVQQNWRALRYAAEEPRVNKDIVLEAVRQKAEALELAAEERRMDADFVSAAIKQNEDAIEFAPETVRHQLENIWANRTAVATTNPRDDVQDASAMLKNGSTVQLGKLFDDVDATDAGTDAASENRLPALLVSTAQFHGTLRASDGKALGHIAAEAFVPGTGQILTVPFHAISNVVPPPHSLAVLRARVIGERAPETLKRAMRVYGDRPCIGWELLPGDWRWLSFREVHLRAEKISVALCLKIQPGYAIGIGGPNSTSWIVVFIACLLRCITLVPLSMSYGSEELAHIISEARLGIICAPPSMLRLCVNADKQYAQSLTLVASQGDDSDWPGEKLSTWEKNPPSSGVSAEGYQHGASAVSSPCVIFYTSGSTGTPKGVVISSECLNERLASFVDRTESDASGVGLIDSPLSVTSALSNLLAFLVNGGRVAVYQDLSRVFEVAKMVEPTSLSLVPMLWEFLHKQFLERCACAEDEADLKAEFASTLGRRIRNISCGGAQPNPVVMLWLQQVFAQARVIENYGSTELGSIAWTTPENGEGLVHDSVDVRLLDDAGVVHDIRDVEEAFVEASSLLQSSRVRGEICVKTPGMASGYYNRPDLTQEAFTHDGYFKTGDLGECIGKGRVRIVGRKQDVFKLSNGEFATPGAIEHILSLSPYVEQVFVHGNSSMPAVVAIIVPTDRAASMSNDRMLVEISAVALTGSLRPAHVPAFIHISSERFSMENGLLTQSQKLCRPALRHKFSSELAMLAETCCSQNMSTSSRVVGEAVRLVFAACQACGGADTPAVSAEMEKKWECLHWDSLAAVHTVEALRREHALNIPLVLLLGKPTLRPVVAAATGARSSTTVAEANWKTDIGSLGSLPECSPDVRNLADRPQEVFVTGATGFLGCAVLHQLLSQQRCCIALVRGLTDAEARARLVQSMQRCGYWNGGRYDQLLTVIAGDVEKSKFGLGTEEFKGLVGRIGGGIVHCAAKVRHLATYASLRGTNVDGTKEILKLAASAGCRLVHLSTVDAVAYGSAEVLPQAHKGPPSSNGYASTKWVAEQLVGTAIASGELDALVVRAGLLTSDTKTGAANMEDWLTRFVVGAVRLGGAAIAYGDAGNQTETLHVAPVDFAASVVVCALRHGSSGEIWHIPFAPLDAKDFISAISTALAARAGPVLAEMDDEDWARCMLHLPPGNPLFPLRHQFLRGLPGTQPHEIECTVNKINLLTQSKTEEIHCDICALAENLQSYVESFVDQLKCNDQTMLPK